ncbi:MAG: AIR synthase-related protein [Candidatus Micrarchaeota archaeon]
MVQRVEITLKDHIPDTNGLKFAEKIRQVFGINVVCRFFEAFNLEQSITSEEFINLVENVLIDPLSQRYSLGGSLFKPLWRIEITKLPGITDNIGNTASYTISDSVGLDIPIHYSKVYCLDGDQVNEVLCEKVAAMIHNPVMERYVVHAPNYDALPLIPDVAKKQDPTVERISLCMSKRRFERLMKERSMCLSVEEFLAIKRHFKKEHVIKQRRKVGLDTRITDVELEMFAQAWGEHCKHKVFNALITYEEEGEKHAINSLFSTFIQGATDQIKKPYVLSAFTDNGGIIKFNHAYDLAIKVESYNSSSVIDPYGGALTGILGVQRDVLGTGLGATPIANMDVLCFGVPDTNLGDLPKGVIHPKAMYNGVVDGIGHGGNKTGIPTVSGSLIFEKDYLCRPVVYCGSIGILPSKIQDHRSSDKSIKKGDLVVMISGRSGKYRLPKATLSSMELDRSVPKNIVPMGDPLTQKKMIDFIIESRDQLLYTAITDNDIGGISSSMGELVHLSGGCEIYIEKYPLNQEELAPWQILLLNIQESMILAVSPEKIQALIDLAKIHDIDATVIGKFTGSGKFHALYNDQTVAYIDIKFMHECLPQMKLKANWKKLLYHEPDIPTLDYGETLLRLLTSPNITSKENTIRKYDHEVKGMSVIKPVMIGPSDAAVIRPFHNSEEGIIISHGICPKYVHGGYVMTSLAFDEAVRNAIAVGARFGYLACLSNFSWPDPVRSEKTPDGEQKLGVLVRSCIALYDCATGYNIPIISGKDSVKNDFYFDDKKYSIPPTLLITMVGKIDNTHRALCSEFKNSGDMIYVLGTTTESLGGSEFYKLFSAIGNYPPELNIEENVRLYKAISKAIEDGFVESAHDISDGGLAVAFAECALGLDMAADLDISAICAETDSVESLLFSEGPGRFIVSVKAENSAKFEAVMKSTICKLAGRVRGDRRFIIRKGENLLINLPIESLREAYGKGI